MRTVLPTLAIMTLLAAPALAQQPQSAQPQAAQPAPVQPQAAQPSAEQSLKQDPNVVQSQGPQPSPQGTRVPEPSPSDTGNVTLTQALEQVWNAPVDLQGNAIQRPNPLGSGPPPAKNPDAGRLPEGARP
ncbi:hypothetical protein [Benzoatithermus flavus]|uniref:Uncharacterized protein n=1 Tax=Benzoatithermus flavus TaxID=3108223 RepID=A0ABU8XQM5_9PROT